MRCAAALGASRSSSRSPSSRTGATSGSCCGWSSERPCPIGYATARSRRSGWWVRPRDACTGYLRSGSRCPRARWRLVKSGWGAGQRNPEHYPNALRVLVAEQAAEAGRVTLLATDLDDMSPEYVEPLRQALVAAGALDVQTWPVQMKKGRSGFRVEVVAPEELGEAVTAALFRHSTTAGVRRWVAERATLARHQLTVRLDGVAVRVKVLDGGSVRVKPEYDDVLAAAQALGRPPLEVARAVERDAETMIAKTKE